jgi:hypothetical protein
MASTMWYFDRGPSMAEVHSVLYYICTNKLSVAIGESATLTCKSGGRPFNTPCAVRAARLRLLTPALRPLKLLPPICLELHPRCLKRRRESMIAQAERLAKDAVQ